MKERIPIWISIINDANISESVKEDCRQKIEVLNSGTLYSEVTQDFPYTTIDLLRRILKDAVENGESKEEVAALFGNLKEDLMACDTEIKLNK